MLKFKKRDNGETLDDVFFKKQAQWILKQRTMKACTSNKEVQVDHIEELKGWIDRNSRNPGAMVEVKCLMQKHMDIIIHTEVNISPHELRVLVAQKTMEDLNNR